MRVARAAILKIFKNDFLFARQSRFLSNFPTKRIQIVLKLVKSPKDVLLNFDLDLCAMGYDGTELWMLPRSARAIQSTAKASNLREKSGTITDATILAGYSVFTMDLVHGHYLGERRATQESRCVVLPTEITYFIHHC